MDKCFLSQVSSVGWGIGLGTRSRWDEQHLQKRGDDSKRDVCITHRFAYL